MSFAFFKYSVRVTTSSLYTFCILDFSVNSSRKEGGLFENRLNMFNSSPNRSSKKGEKAVPTKFSARVFLEEPGKTKIVSLLHLGDSNKVLANLDSGDEVVLKLGSHRISVCTLNRKYIGRLPDDLSVSLIKLIKRGNEYQVFVKSSKPQEIKVFIRETKRAKDLESIPSFSSEKINYISFTPPELVHKKQTIKETGEDD